ncbi:ribosome silencing factor [Methylibium petroleiphilum]|uniref:ribosome silencing factor n=1 Tax=Methylibium petroleiphilum TaxID=105560 RepID=UPI001ACF8732|nr:ribosome silencing factor [Methylibium petroleiphilum]MBN9203196.1 ribosome silencing factor [Methylibium petroleiphilum]
MDIRKLQRAIVDGLEDVKAQDIQVFNTEHLSPLFERVIMASGLSNRQTKALAASVRDAVRSHGFPVMRTEGEDNGEWIIVDCGAAVAHIMQPEIRRYYHLEEIWGGKSVKMKFGAVSKGLVKASAPDEAPAETKQRAATKKPAAKYASRPGASAPAAPARKSAAAKAPAARKAPARKTAASAPVAKKASTRSAPTTRAPATKRAPAKKAAPSRKTSRA